MEGKGTSIFPATAMSEALCQSLYKLLSLLIFSDANIDTTSQMRKLDYVKSWACGGSVSLFFFVNKGRASSK